jgi:hemerythrin-like metal-binding protein
MTTPIDWVEVLETGIADLDDEHRGLIDLCNSLTEALDAGRPWPEVVAAAARLSAACRRHFLSEESLLQQTEFPRREQHAQQHRAIERRFDELVDLMKSVDGSRAEDRAAVSAMRGTLIDILFRHDLDYKSHLQNVAGR